MLDVCLLGTSGMMPLPRRALTALMTRFNGSSLLIDCGEGTQVSIREKGWSMHDIDLLCITHTHGDHVSGLPGLLLSIGNTDRKEPLRIVGPKGTRKVVNALLTIAPGLPFEIQIDELTEPVCEFAANGYKIRAFRVSHTVPCYGYSQMIERAGKFDVERARAQNIPMRLWNVLQKGQTIEEEGKIYTPDMVLGERRKGLKVTYCTDTKPVPVIAQEAKGADLFICEGMYGEPGMEDKAREKKHMTFFDAAHIAKEAQVKELWLTHFSPSLIRPDLCLEEPRKIFPATKVGKDRKTIELLFDE